MGVKYLSLLLRFYLLKDIKCVHLSPIFSSLFWGPEDYRIRIHKSGVVRHRTTQKRSLNFCLYWFTDLIYLFCTRHLSKWPRVPEISPFSVGVWRQRNLIKQKLLPGGISIIRSSVYYFSVKYTTKSGLLRGFLRKVSIMVSGS